MTRTATGKKLLLISAGLSLALALSACQTTGMTPSARGDFDSIMGDAATQAEARGRTAESLALLESLYKRNAADPRVAVRYAHALRTAGQPERAALILAPFSSDTRAPDFDAKLEYAETQAGLGDYLAAETAARGAVLLKPESGEAYHILGIALDAQGQHKQAEVAFRKALENWQGDSSTVMNNLGLNLASQGFIDEALETLRKAQAMAPQRIEIERNIRIVSALQYSPPKEGMRLVPKPPRKPLSGPAAQGGGDSDSKKTETAEKKPAAPMAPRLSDAPAVTAAPAVAVTSVTVDDKAAEPESEAPAAGNEPAAPAAKKKPSVND